MYYVECMIESVDEDPCWQKHNHPRCCRSLEPLEWTAFCTPRDSHHQIISS